ncbi:hypothetical protein E4T56_gene12961 [Termitomyces sp. T112]|nr:hypothetical protein E4T56_gene12961 [Termitomyces sp. T112]
MERTSTQPRTNPDGDAWAFLTATMSFRIVHRACWNTVEIISTNPKYQDIENSNKILIIGTTLATYSAYRLLKHALELKKPIMLLNVGPTRADGVAGVVKIDMASGTIMRDVARIVLGSKATDDPIVAEMLRSGIVKAPPMEHE